MDREVVASEIRKRLPGELTMLEAVALMDLLVEFEVTAPGVFALNVRVGRKIEIVGQQRASEIAALVVGADVQAVRDAYFGRAFSAEQLDSVHDHLRQRLNAAGMYVGGP